MCTLDGEAHYGFGANKVSGARRYAEAAVRHWPAMAPEQYRFGPKADDSHGILDMWRTLFAAIDAIGLPGPERFAARRSEPQVLLDLANAASKRTST